MAQRVLADIEATGREAHFFNVNAADEERRAEVAGEMERVLTARGEMGQLRILIHSLAFGTLKLFIAEPMKDAVVKSQMDMTSTDGDSLVMTRTLSGAALMDRATTILTSAGQRVLPDYGRILAKAALESNIRQLAAELAPRGITANAIRAGVTDTPALQKIPGSDAIKDGAVARNPSGRLTTTEDVARAIVVLSHPDTYWITGNVIGVDGGEDITG